MQTVPKPFEEYEIEYLRHAIERIRDAANPAMQLDEELKQLNPGGKKIDEGFEDVYKHLESLKLLNVKLTPTRLNIEINKFSGKRNETSMIPGDNLIDSAIKNLANADVLLASSSFDTRSGSRSSGFEKGA